MPAPSASAPKSSWPRASARARSSTPPATASRPSCAPRASGSPRCCGPRPTGRRRCCAPRARRRPSRRCSARSTPPSRTRPCWPTSTLRCCRSWRPGTPTRSGSSRPKTQRRPQGARFDGGGRRVAVRGAQVRPSKFSRPAQDRRVQRDRAGQAGRGGAESQKWVDAAQAEAQKIEHVQPAAQLPAPDATPGLPQFAGPTMGPSSRIRPTRPSSTRASSSRTPTPTPWGRPRAVPTGVSRAFRWRSPGVRSTRGQSWR